MEPHLSFHHAGLKLIWANQLITNLNREIELFAERKPYRISLKPDPDGGGYLFQVGLVEAIPHTIPCLIGDICHNLRASADYCWMGLVRATNPNAEKTTLPICSNAKGIKTTAAQTFEGEALAKVVDLLMNRIKSHYDFEAGGNVGLANLNYLSNWQKHNMLVPSFGVTELGDNTIIKSNDGTIGDFSRAKVNGRMATIGGSEVEMTYDSEPTVQIFLKLKYLPFPQPVIVTLLDFRELMRQSLKAFCEIWPSDQNPRFD